MKSISKNNIIAIIALIFTILLASSNAYAMVAQTTGGSQLKNIAATGDSISFTPIEREDSICTHTGDSGWTTKTRDTGGVYLTHTFSKGKTPTDLVMYYNERLQVGNTKYDVKMSIKSVETTANKCMIAIHKGTPGIMMNVEFNIDGTDTRPESSDRVGSNEVEVEIELINSQTKEPAILPGVFFAMIDLDGEDGEKAEAWTINGYAPNSTNTYVKSDVGQYIRYKGSTVYGTRSNNNTDNAYVAVDTMRNGGVTKLYYSGIVSEGLQGNYGSVLHFYETEHTVNYTTDGNGTITGNNSENIVDYGNPSCTTENANEGFHFTHWTCDKDVELNDGTEITAGTPITSEQVTNVVVLEDLVFTAHYEELLNVSYEWKGIHPNQNPPEGEEDIIPGSKHTVDTTFVKGETKVREAKDGQDGYYLFEGWDNEGEIEINENTVIKGTWSFHPLYKITTKATEEENGYITENLTEIEENETKVIDYGSNEGYQIKSITVDGKTVNKYDYPTKYTFEEINEDHNIEVVFEKIPNIEIQKVADKKTVSAGDTVNYTVTVSQTNEGAEARDVVVKDTMPEGMTLVSISLPDIAKLVSKDGNEYEFKVDSLEEEMSYTYTVKTSEDYEGDMVNTVQTEASNVPENKEASETVKSVKPESEITKEVSNESPEYNESVLYTIKMKQTKAGAVLKDAVMTDKIPEGLEVDEDSIKVSDETAEVTFKDNVLTVKKDTLVSEVIVTFKAKVTIMEGDVNNVAVMTGYKIDEKRDNAKVVIKQPQLSLIKKVNKENVVQNQTVTYTIIANVKNATALNAVVKDIIPAGISVKKDSITCDNEDASIEFEDGVIKVSFKKLYGKAKIQFKGTVRAESGKLKNIALFNASNNPEGKQKASATIEITPQKKEQEDEVARETSQTGDDILKYGLICGGAILLLVGALVLRKK